MPKITIGFAVILIALGLVSYFGTGTTSVTALIPAFVGLLLLAAGVLGLREPLRKHAMHGAAMISLLGLLGALRGLPDFFTLLGGGQVARPQAAVVQSVMAVVCAVFLALCIRSFVAARRARVA